MKYDILLASMALLHPVIPKPFAWNDIWNEIYREKYIEEDENGLK